MTAGEVQNLVDNCSSNWRCSISKQICLAVALEKHERNKTERNVVLPIFFCQMANGSLVVGLLLIKDFVKSA